MPTVKSVTVTDLRMHTREILENAHFRGWQYLVERAGQPMVAILGYEEFERLVASTQPVSAETAKPNVRRRGASATDQV